MKKLLLIMITILYCSSTFAVEYKAKVVFEKSIRTEKAEPILFDGQPFINNNVVYKSNRAHSVNLPGQVIGETAYVYQTNDNMKDRLIWDKASNSLQCVWMYGDIAETPTGFPNRRMFYNYFDGSSWVHGKGIPVENEKRRAGYGALQVDPNNAALAISHFTVNEASNVWYDFMAGFGFFTKTVIWEATEWGDKDIQASWPDLAVDEQDIWNVVTINNNQDDWVRIVNDVYKNILRFRTTDRGQNWTEWIPLFPDTSTYPLRVWSDVGSACGPTQIEAADDASGKVGILSTNPRWDMYFFESDNRGETFNDPILVKNSPYPKDDDSLSFPIRWDVVVEYDSVTLVAIDTFLYPFSSETDSLGNRTARPNLRPSPSYWSHADLIYINGEPHAAWTELFTVGEYSYWPQGLGYTLSENFSLLDGSKSHYEGNFAVKHWSPSTGISTVFLHDSTISVWAGNFQHYVATPQLGVDEAGNVYCLFIKHSDSDTLLPEDNVDQLDTSDGVLSFGKVWGAKSTDGGLTWGEAIQLISEEDSWHQAMRYVSVANKNPNDKIHIMWINSDGIPGTAITGDSREHNTHITADIRYWGVPTTNFPEGKTNYYGADIELKTSSTMGGLDFGDIGEAGEAQAIVTVMNKGDKDLQVTGAFAGEKAFSAEPATFTVAPRGSQEVVITFKPLVTEPYDTYVALPNNDPNEGSVGFPVTGVGIPKSEKVTQSAGVPTKYQLVQNYPNPFNPSTTIQFTLSKSCRVKCAVYNTLGEQVAVLINGNKQAGSHTLHWKPTNLSSGVYFYTLTTEEFSDTKKMIYLQ